MNEGIYTRDKSSKRRVEPENTARKKTHGDRLKNEQSRAKAMREKLRHGKADTAETKLEIKKTAKIHKQGRKAARKNVAVSGEIRHQLNEANEDNNAGGDAINAGGQLAENGIYSAKKRAGKSADKSGYGDKLHGKTVSKTETVEAHEAQKNLMKKEIQRHAFKEQARETANASGGFMKRFVDKAEDMAGKLSEAVKEFVEDHPLGLLIAAVVLIVVLVFSSALSSCSMMAGGGNNMVLATSFTAQDADIVAVENDYKNLEAELQRKIDNIETDYPGYDEYNYSLSEISHNPFELAALLTVLYEDYTESEVQTMLQTIFDYEYTLNIQRVVETRTRTETRWHWVTYYDEDGDPTRKRGFYQRNADGDQMAWGPIRPSDHDQFADDPQDGLHSSLREPVAGHVEAHRDLGVPRLRADGPKNRLVHVLLLERAAPEVPEAALEFLAAGGEHLAGNGEGTLHGRVRARVRGDGGVDLQRDAGERLGD